MYTLVVIERVSYLVHDIVRMLKEAHDTIVELNTHVIAIFLQAERTEVEIL